MIDRLRELLRAAKPETKGRWVYRRCDFGQGPVDDYSYVEWGDHVEGYGTAALSVPMARYLAALSPKAVAELLDAHDRMAGALAKAERLNAMLPDELTRLADLLEAKVPLPSNRTDYFEGWLDAVHAVREELLAARAALAVPKEENPDV